MKKLALLFLFITFSIYGFSQADITKPVFDSAWFEPSTIKNGDTITLYVKAHDNISGVSNFGAYVRSQSGGTDQNVSDGFIQVSDSIYKKEIVISQWAASETWYLSTIAIWDNAGNDYQNQYMTKSVSPATFIVNSSTPDIIEPVFDSAWFEPSTIKNGDTITLFVKAYDNLSGVSNFGAYVRSPSGGTDQNVSDGFIQVSDSIYKKEIVISQWAESGTWYLSTIAIWDNAGNDYQNQYMTRSVSPATFIVNSSTPDIIEPVFDSAWFEPSTIKNGDAITLYVKIHDNLSGVSDFGAYVRSPSGGTDQNVSDNFIQVSDSIYKKEIVISQWAESGTWYLSTIAIWDNAGNDYQNQYRTESVSPATFIVNTTASIDNLIRTENNLFVYPNPASDLINIKSEEANQYFIYNKNGIFVEKGTKHIINISNLASDMYLLKVVNKNGSISTVKVIKK